MRLPSCRQGQWGILSLCPQSQHQCYCWWALHTLSWCQGSSPPPGDTIQTLGLKSSSLSHKIFCSQKHRHCQSMQVESFNSSEYFWRVSTILTWTPKRSSLSCLFRRAHSDCCPCSRFVHMAISPQVMSAPRRLHTRRKGKFPHWGKREKSLKPHL